MSFLIIILDWLFFMWPKKYPRKYFTDNKKDKPLTPYKLKAYLKLRLKEKSHLRFCENEAPILRPISVHHFNQLLNPGHYLQKYSQLIFRWIRQSLFRFQDLSDPTHFRSHQPKLRVNSAEAKSYQTEVILFIWDISKGFLL